jgi:DNA-binding transcriptional ArsR family regulator
VEARDGRRELRAFDDTFGALAHATRRHVLVVLHGRGGAMTSGEIARRFHHSWPTVTRHLQILVRSKLVRVERRGRERVYHLQLDRLLDTLDQWTRAFRARRSGPAR